MVTTSRKCKVCGKAGAHSFNDLCNPCWQNRIEQNVKIMIQNKKEQL